MEKRQASIQPAIIPAATTGRLIPGGGKTGELVRAFDWGKTAIGPIDTWPHSLCISINIVLQSPVPMVMLWGKDGIMIYNDAYSVFAGKRHPQLLGSKVVEGWPEVADFNRNVMAQGLSGKTLSYEGQQLTLYRNDVAEDVSMDLNYSPIIGDDGKPAGVLAIVIETTQRVQAEQRQREAEIALREEQQRLQSIFSQAPALIAVLRGTDHVFEMANPMYVNTVAPGRDIIGQPMLTAIPELAGQGVVEILDDVLAAGKPYVGEMHVKLDRFGTGTTEDAYFNLIYQPLSSRESGTADGIFVHAVEITDQVTSRQRAEDLNAQLEAVFDSLPDGLYIAAGNEITRLNQRGAEVLGYASPDEVPRNLDELYRQVSVRQTNTGKSLRAEDSTLGNALRGRHSQHIGVRVTNSVTGTERILRTAGAPIRNKRGEVIGAVAINNDLTEQYRMQEKMQKEIVRRRLLTQKTKLLRIQNEELTRLNATKNEFIALTSHQLRTPATGVKQYIGMLLQGYAGPVTTEQQQFLERAFESNERQLHIIEDILRVAKVDMGKTQLRRQKHDVCKLVQNILDEQSDQFGERKLKLTTLLPGGPLYAEIDTSQLHMAIGNIVDNAIKYSPDDKQITVRVSRTTGGEIHIEVADQGVGIAKADQNKLFQKFSRIPNARSIAVGGTGLGLYWTRRILELHGGTIEVVSRAGRGTRFIISLPAA